MAKLWKNLLIRRHKQRRPVAIQHRKSLNYSRKSRHTNANRHHWTGQWISSAKQNRIHGNYHSCWCNRIWMNALKRQRCHQDSNHQLQCWLEDIIKIENNNTTTYIIRTVNIWIAQLWDVDRFKLRKKSSIGVCSNTNEWELKYYKEFPASIWNLVICRCDATCSRDVVKIQ